MKIFDIINENNNRSDIIRKTAADLNIPFAIAMELFNKESKTGQFDKDGNTVVGDTNRTNKAYGMGQVRKPALDDVNRLYGTNYSLDDIKNDANINAKVGLLYFKAQGDHYGANDWEEQLRGYNGGPSAIKGGNAASDSYANQVWNNAVFNYDGPDALEKFQYKTVTNEDKKTWMKDGVEMCSKDCCGQPVTECECGPECKHCDCYKVNERYSLAQGRPAMGKFTNDQKNMNKRMNNKLANTNRELTIKQTQMNKNANRDARRLPTGTPNRAAYDNMRQDLLRGRGIQNQ